MADAIMSFDITVGDIAYVLFVRGTISIGKGIANLTRLRKRHQCEWCQKRRKTHKYTHNTSSIFYEV